jgi:hypothetical protein
VPRTIFKRETSQGVFFSQEILRMASDLRKKSTKQALLIISKSVLCELLGHNRQNPMLPEVVLYFFNNNKKACFVHCFRGSLAIRRNFWRNKKHLVKYLFDDCTRHPSCVIMAENGVLSEE